MLAMGLAILGASCASPQLPEPAQDSGSPPHAATGSPTPPTPSVPVPVQPATVPATKFALLLPLSGEQSAAGEAVRAGFIAAWLADAGASRPEVIILDEARGGAREAFERAAGAGATMVVGPLLKESVAEVLPVAGAMPTLALNNLEVPLPTPPTFHQFGLAPEDEARQVAERAAAEGQLRALAFVPDSEWGRRVLTAFMSALEQRGGTVLGYRFYEPRATDFTSQLQRLLLVDESREREGALSRYLGIPLEFEPRRRGDVDFIFLAANVASGRLIRPQLRFLYAGDVPTYATSAIYLAGSNGDPDLEGIRFMDAPALLSPDSRALLLRAALERRWPPGAAGRMRFHAMGYDAYELARSIAVGSAAGLFGLSGLLEFDTERRVHRRMPWAEFRNGRLALLPDIEAAQDVTPPGS